VRDQRPDFPSPSSTGIAVFAEGGTATLAEISITALTGSTNHHEMAGDLLPARG
jgi:hypothetical protein